MSDLRKAIGLTPEEFLPLLQESEVICFSLIDFRALPESWNNWIDYQVSGSNDVAAAMILRVPVYIRFDTASYFIREGVKTPFFLLKTKEEN